MPKNVQMPDGSVVQFPDGMSDDQIASVLKQQHPAADPGLHGAMERIFGKHPVSDTLGNIVQHAENLVAGPYHAFTDAPRNPEEQRIKGTDENSGAIANALGQFGLGAARMFVQPTREAVQEAIELRKKGGPQASLLAPSSYDAHGNNIPTAGSKLVDAIPIYGPWSRNYADEVHQKGFVPATAGLVTDVEAPKVAGKAAIAVTKGPLKGVSFALDKAGRLAEFSGATTKAQKLMASRLVVAGTPGELLQRALKPSVHYGADATTLFEDTLPSVLAVDPEATSVAKFGAAADAARDVQGSRYDARIAPYREVPEGAYGTAPRPGAIHGPTIAEAQMNSIPLMDRIERPAQFHPGNPGRLKVVSVPGGEGTKMTMGGYVGGTPDSWTGGIVNKTAEVADNYRRPIPVAVADTLRQDSNAKLNAFYAKSGGDRAAALSNPETARVKAVGDATRQLLYEKLAIDAGITPGDIAAEQQLYGKLVNVSDIANKRDAVFSRHDPVSLAEKIATDHGGPISRVTNYISQKALRSITDSDALVGSAVDRFINPEETPSEPAQGIRGLAAKAGTAIRDAGKAVAPSGKGAGAISPSIPTIATAVAAQTNLKGPGKWAVVGAANLNEYVNANPSAGLTVDDIKALQDNPKAQSILYRASDLKPGSKAMDALAKEARAILENR
jgi:hypothetical protein